MTSGLAIHPLDPSSAQALYVRDFPKGYRVVMRDEGTATAAATTTLESDLIAIRDSLAAAADNAMRRGNGSPAGSSLVPPIPSRDGLFRAVTSVPSGSASYFDRLVWTVARCCQGPSPQGARGPRFVGIGVVHGTGIDGDEDEAPEVTVLQEAQNPSHHTHDAVFLVWLHRSHSETIFRAIRARHSRGHGGASSRGWAGSSVAGSAWRENEATTAPWATGQSSPDARANGVAGMAGQGEVDEPARYSPAGPSGPVSVSPVKTLTVIQFLLSQWFLIFQAVLAMVILAVLAGIMTALRRGCVTLIAALVRTASKLPMGDIWDGIFARLSLSQWDAYLQGRGGDGPGSPAAGQAMHTATVTEITAADTNLDTVLGILSMCGSLFTAATSVAPAANVDMGLDSSKDVAGILANDLRATRDLIHASAETWTEQVSADLYDLETVRTSLEGWADGSCGIASAVPPARDQGGGQSPGVTLSDATTTPTARDGSGQNGRRPETCAPARLADGLADAAGRLLERLAAMHAGRLRVAEQLESISPDLGDLLAQKYDKLMRRVAGVHRQLEKAYMERQALREGRLGRRGLGMRLGRGISVLWRVAWSENSNAGAASDHSAGQEEDAAVWGQGGKLDLAVGYLRDYSSTLRVGRVAFAKECERPRELAQELRGEAKLLKKWLVRVESVAAELDRAHTQDRQLGDRDLARMWTTLREVHGSVVEDQRRRYVVTG